MNLSNFLRLELKKFLGGGAVSLAVACLLIAGFYAAWQGAETIGKQRAIIEKIPAYQAEHLAKQLEINNADLGNALYYLQFATVHQPSSWAGFSVGQRDVNPFAVKTRMLALEGQLYDSEMSNPQNSLYGNFDMAFVIVYLFPLLIIAFCHNLISEEQENGSWNLLRSQPVAVAKIIGWRFLLRFAFAFGLAFLLIAANCVYQRAALDGRFWEALWITAAYLGFWFALAALVVAWGKTTAWNALVLLGAWIFLTILAPALLNLLISTFLPVSEAFELTVKQRESYHQKWDKPRAETMAKFYAKYPQYKEFPIPEDKFSWGWYYAAQNQGDEEAGDATKKYLEKLEKRDYWTNLIAFGLPPLRAQLAFNSLSQNDLRGHLDYLQSVREHHRKIREFFYPHIFRGSKVADVDWASVPSHDFDNETQAREFPASVLALVFCALLIGAFAWRGFFRMEKLA